MVVLGRSVFPPSDAGRPESTRFDSAQAEPPLGPTHPPPSDPPQGKPVSVEPLGLEPLGLEPVDLKSASVGPAGPEAGRTKTGRNEPGSNESGSNDPGAAGQMVVRSVRRHLLFGVLFATGLGLRAVVGYAYRPAFEFSGDSYAYLRLSTLAKPDPMRPAGYPAFLRLLSNTGDLWWVTVVQHAMGLAIGVALYALLVRRRVATPIAALAAAPVLLDAYQLDIEHYVMAETLFAVLIVGAIVALMWSPRPAWWACGLAGLLLGAAGLVRTIGVAVGVLAIGYLLLRRAGWLRFASFLVMLAGPLAGYAVWFHSAHGNYALTGGDAVWMYGRVAPIAECDRLHLSTKQLVLCSPHPVAERPDPSYYVWNGNSPHWRLDVPDDERDRLLTDFTRQVIRHQFGDYVRMVGGELVHYVRPGRPVGHRDWPDATWRFPTGQEPRYLHNNEPLLGFHETSPGRVMIEPYAGFLRDYQRIGFTPGPALAAMAVLVLVAIVLPARRRMPLGLRGSGARRRWREAAGEHPRLRADLAFLLAASATMLVVPAATVCFDYRYLLPVLVLLPPAAALAVRRLVLVHRSRTVDEAPPGVASAAAGHGPDGADAPTNESP